MNKLRRNNGLMLVEVLLVLGLTGILMSVGFVSVGSYLRGMTKVEYDGYAKEIFVAAQNHLSMAAEQGYLGRDGYGTPEAASDGTLTGVYYFADEEKSGGGRLVDSDGTVLNLMLPVGAVDGTVRNSGSYLIRWHKDSAQVLDVFYWSESDSRFAHKEYETADYAKFLERRSTSDALEKYEDNSVIGYYGGVEASQPHMLSDLKHGERLNAPKITVTNGDKLTVKLENTNSRNTNVTTRLIITGQTSKVSIPLDIAVNGHPNLQSNISHDASTDIYTITLDDITTQGLHFYNLFCNPSAESPYGAMIPGEDISIQAVAVNNTELTNVAYSSTQTTNSLFGSGTSGGTAKISSIRHLENLDATVSKVNSSNSVKITKAEQTTDLDWTQFVGSDGSIYGMDSSEKAVKSFFPVTPGYTLEYNGQGHSISKIKVDQTDQTGNAGLFGTLSDGSVSNLKLVDFSEIKGSNAGALAGTVQGGAAVTNVIAFNRGSSSDATIKGTASTGGLVGSSENCTFNLSAAALVVSTTGTGGNAGGLIGTANGTTVTGCFSGGHTSNAAYDTSAFNVTGTNAGGLIGSIKDGSIQNSYSTCSASGTTAGGFAGAVDGTDLTKCYATGRVQGTTAGAFAGTLTGSGATTNCTYYEIVNEVPVDGDTTGAKGYTYLSGVAGSDGSYDVTAFDEDVTTYEAFVGTDRKSALVYDPALNQYYQASYTFPTVKQLGAVVGSDGFVSMHYGDWPAPEVWVVNEKN